MRVINLKKYMIPFEKSAVVSWKCIGALLEKKKNIQSQNDKIAYIKKVRDFSPSSFLYLEKRNNLAQVLEPSYDRIF